jgi:hypothetical protein
MPQVRLLPQGDGGLRLNDGRAPEVYLPSYRLRMWVLLGTDPFPHQAVVDTGAPAAIFPYSVWSKLADRGDITWVRHPPGTTARRNLPRTILLGGSYPFRLGRVVVKPVDFAGGELRPTPVPVQCLEDTLESPADPKPLTGFLVLGLNGRLHGRTLTVSASADGAAWAAALAE